MAARFGARAIRVELSEAMKVTDFEETENRERGRSGCDMERKVSVD